MQGLQSMSECRGGVIHRHIFAIVYQVCGACIWGLNVGVLYTLPYPSNGSMRWDLF